MTDIKHYSIHTSRLVQSKNEFTSNLVIEIIDDNGDVNSSVLKLQEGVPLSFLVGDLRGLADELEGLIQGAE